MNRRQCLVTLLAIGSAIATLDPSAPSRLEAELLACFARLPDVVQRGDSLWGGPGFEYTLIDGWGQPMWGGFEAGTCTDACLAMAERGWLVRCETERDPLEGMGSDYFRLSGAGREVMRRHGITADLKPNGVRQVCARDWQRRPSSTTIA